MAAEEIENIRKVIDMNIRDFVAGAVLDSIQTSRNSISAKEPVDMLVEGASDSMDGEKKDELYNRQMELLRLFRDRGAISTEQYEKSSSDLTSKMYPNGREKTSDEANK